MAISLESANKVRQKAFHAAGVASPAGTSEGNGDPIAQYALKNFFLNWAANKGNQDLQFVPFSEADADDADGTGIVDAACRVYFVFTKKENSATDNWTKLYNETTVDTTTTAAYLAIPQLEANASSFYVSSQGIPFSAGVVVTQHTELIGVTDGSNGAGGFIIIGAP